MYLCFGLVNRFFQIIRIISCYNLGLNEVLAFRYLSDVSLENVIEKLLYLMNNYKLEEGDTSNVRKGMFFYKNKIF